MVGTVIAVIVLLFIGYQLFAIAKKRRTRVSSVPEAFPEQWKQILENKVGFYERLSATAKHRFEQRILELLKSVLITSVKTTIDDEDRLLIAASGIIPIFYLTETTYPNLREILVYPNNFGRDHQITGNDRRIAGMVGNGYMTGTMILSKSHLLSAFMNEKDGQHTPIHEFIHLVDGWDGQIDGVPEAILNQNSYLPWVEGIRQGLEDIRKRKSSLDSYGGTNPQEFFAVATEYFFENPKKLKQNHPEMYALMDELFHPTK
ncbi:MAG: zinc-dependent peptidase [Flavobacteriales bacterium]|nr:zinc-dependent peptidase [Flavobacteriales bacterium]